VSPTLVAQPAAAAAAAAAAATEFNAKTETAPAGVLS